MTGPPREQDWENGTGPPGENTVPALHFKQDTSTCTSHFSGQVDRIFCPSDLGLSPDFQNPQGNFAFCYTSEKGFPFQHYCETHLSSV